MKTKGTDVCPFFRTAFNYDTAEASTESGLRCDDPTLAQQQFKEECDINTIVTRFGLTGELPSDVNPPRYGDFLEVADYQGAMNVVRAADEAFMQLPWQVRRRFNDDPGAFVEFFSDPANQDEAIKLGLATKLGPVVPAPVGDVEVPPKEA